MLQILDEEAAYTEDRGTMKAVSLSYFAFQSLTDMLQVGIRQDQDTETCAARLLWDSDQYCLHVFRTLDKLVLVHDIC